jgi:hypothetical protein
VDQNQPATPPRELKPWYYQDWFLFPVFVFWPVWAVLILRSPWHNGLVSGAVAWAMLIVGAYVMGWEQLIQTGRLHNVALVLVLPGLALTVVTQVQWARDKPRVTQGSQPQSPPPAAPPPAAGSPGRGRRRRRSSRRR